MSEIDLSSPEVIAAIEAAVEKATGPLLAKRDELLGEVKKLRKGQQIDPEELARVEQERDDAKAALAEASKAAKKAAQDAEKAIQAQAKAEGAMTELLVDGGLTDALVKAGVTNPALQKAARTMLKTQAQVADDNGQKVVRIGDKALADAISEWAGSDEGKHFVTASDTSGMGSTHSRGGGAATKSVTRAQFDGMAPADRSAHFASGGIVTD